MFIYNRILGTFTPYACSFQAVDCEGLVFMTQIQDPYGKVTVDPCD